MIWKQELYDEYTRTHAHFYHNFERDALALLDASTGPWTVRAFFDTLRFNGISVDLPTDNGVTSVEGPLNRAFGQHNPSVRERLKRKVMETKPRGRTGIDWVKMARQRVPTHVVRTLVDQALLHTESYTTVPMLKDETNVHLDDRLNAGIKVMMFDMEPRMMGHFISPPKSMLQEVA